MKEINFEGIVQKAVFDYGMIEEGDRIAVGVSGGKDSLALLHALAVIRKYSPASFTLSAITLDLGLAPADFSSVRGLCDSLDIPYFVEDTQIGHIVFDVRQEKKPCSLCANLRRGALNNKALSLGCNKVALGHNRDDAIETMAMSLFYEGRLHCFSPVTYLSRKNIHVIRPLIYAREAEIRAYCVQNSLQIVKSPCPATGLTNRAATRAMIDGLATENPHVRELMFAALKKSGISGW
ncbi:MAG: tRNA 2-thiocytidine biosynthesis TtcA family protein [Saccharofermentanales bacterium]